MKPEDTNESATSTPVEIVIVGENVIKKFETTVSIEDYRAEKQSILSDTQAKIEEVQKQIEERENAIKFFQETEIPSFKEQISALQKQMASEQIQLDKLPDEEVTPQ